MLPIVSVLRVTKEMFPVRAQEEIRLVDQIEMRGASKLGADRKRGAPEGSLLQGAQKRVHLAQHTASLELIISCLALGMRTTCLPRLSTHLRSAPAGRGRMIDFANVAASIRPRSAGHNCPG